MSGEAKKMKINRAVPNTSMKQFLECLKENLGKLRDCYNRDPSFSRLSEKVEWIPLLLSFIIFLIFSLVIWIIFSPIMNYIKMRANG